MSRIQIKTGTHYVAHNEIHLIQKRLVDHHYQIENLSTGETTILSHDALLRAWASGDLRFEITSPNVMRDTDVPLNTRY